MRFDTYHPTINLIYFVLVIICSLSFNHPVFIGISFVCAFIYSIKLGGFKAFVIDVVVIIGMIAYTAIYSYYEHFGITPLAQNVIGNSITLEAIVYGIVLSIQIGSLLIWFSCFLYVMSTDKLIYLLGRILPKLSLFISIALRCIPRIHQQGNKIRLAQKSIGRGLGQGNIFRRIRNFFRIEHILITWSIENFVQVSDSMKNRGYTLKKRTAFSIYRFDHRDRSFVITIFFCVTIILMAVLLDQTNIQYNPEIILNNITPISHAFYIAYAFVCLLPMSLQIAGERKFNKLIEKKA